jgi:SAM-dependent methyltransferase
MTGVYTRLLKSAIRSLSGTSGWSSAVRDSGNLSDSFSKYDSAELMLEGIKTWGHRAVIGGMWDEIGDLQAGFLTSQGLRPLHAFIDVGSGSFRAGVKLIPYLDPGNYYAIDARNELLDEGYLKEIEPAKLTDRFPRRNAAATASFDLSTFGRAFDFGIAQSVFTHMPIELLSTCLSAVAPHFRPGGRFYATVFLAPESNAQKKFKQVPGGIVTAPSRDPFHTTLPALDRVAAKAVDWDMTVIGDWEHPRNQQMICFVRKGAL